MAARTLPVCALPGCQEQCWLEQNGQVHQYCGKTHAREAKKGAFSVGVGHQNRTCQLAGCSDSASFDGKRNCWHDFCSRRHASAASGQQWVRGGGGKGASTCKFFGCQRGVFVDPTTGQATAYCSKLHRDTAMGGAANTTAAGPHVDRVLSGGTTSATDFRLCSLSKTHPDYLSLLAQFNSKSGGSGPTTLQRAFKVQVPADVHRRAAAYKRTTGNVKRRFHGTGCSARCSFFADPTGRPCGGKECNVCSICTHGFLLKGTGGLFGKGLYFSSKPDKANAYAQASQKTGTDGKTLRCMFVANVSAGSAFVTNQGSLPSNMCPPPNYDSVVRDGDSGLGHDELVVYKAQAALPTYLIVYSLP